MKYKFGGFTSKANDSVNFAISSAELLGHTYVGSEHLMLGLLSVEDSVAAQILLEKGVSQEKIRELIVAEIGEGNTT